MGSLPLFGYNPPMDLKEKKIRIRGRYQKAADSHSLGYQILLLANEGLLRTDFQREISERLIDFFDCDSVEVWLKDHEKYYPSETVRGLDRSQGIDFRTHKPHPVDEIEGNSNFPAPELSLSGPYRSVSTIPLGVGGENIAFLHLKSRKRNYFSRAEMKSHEGLAQILGIALVHRRIQVDLRERVKELTCLYEIARLSAQPDLSLEELLQATVELIPRAWLYPEITSARILLGERSYSTPRFQEGGHRLSAEIVVSNETRGLLEVTYREERPDLDEGPFLKEERTLIDAVAREMAVILKRRQDDEENARLQEGLRHADRLVTIGQLAAGVAHELNEPLGSILGFAQLAKKCPGLPLQAERDVEKILNASLYAREVVRKLLIFARQMPPRKIPVNLNQVVEEGLSFFESRCTKEGITLERFFSPVLPEVDADPSQLNQVL
ncbi:MAG: hypothetical protein EHM36_11050, partial [Deltaproteobacteria bacterium]